jgi:hypothetical protein
MITPKEVRREINWTLVAAAIRTLAVTDLAQISRALRIVAGAI